MNLKKVPCLILVFAFAASLAFSAEAPTVAFKAGDFYLSPQLVSVNAGSSGKFSLGPNVEYFLSKAIAVGGDVSIYLVSPGGLSLFPDIEYHFNVNVRGLDIFAGAGPSLFVGFGSEGKTLFGGKAFGAARYFFTPSTGVFLKLGIASNKEGTAGLGAIGVSFKL
jgi:hypothetical protein